MSHSRLAPIGRLLFKLSQACSVLIVVGGLYEIMHAEKELGVYAAIYSVATIGMAAFVTWNLGAAARHMLGGD
jgi:hypothetical protein